MGNPAIRMAQYAGSFYPSSADEIKRLISGFIDPGAVKKDAVGCVLPHAGYIYSGRIAVQTVSRINIPERMILIGPNHTGYGEQFSIMTAGSWRTPLGEVAIDQPLATSILENSSYLIQDSLAHSHEHSLEVELPILQYFKPDIKIIPIVVGSDDLAALKAVGKEVARVIKKEKLAGSALIVASSDMTHYESRQQAQVKDQKAIQAILELDGDKLYSLVRSLNISMCGYGPVIIMLAAANELGVKGAQLVKYGSSADSTGDSESVVGYAGIILS